ncbi:protein of unknown function DUF389 containing protein [Nitzschia inconspicua]|uniref:DUF389 domain-containing protein n=1 Tax=Nitzschia inconspicua TaxID=303405 RepID=A0A9K3KVH3_9STRA|nr:protein of unknown function DUF389 containing protein [Nitzschia inconspicua]
MTVDAVTTNNNERGASFGDISEEDMDEEEVEMRLRKMHFDNQETPPVPKNHKVVGRLSRWEGGRAFDKDLFTQSAPVQTDVEEQNYEESDRGVTLRDVVRVFRRSDAFMRVTDEDIERVRTMHDRFLGDCRPSFNYNCLLVIASLIAALGLGSNSVASIIASMLVSPLMGPVVGIAYANTIHDYKMLRIGLVTEIVSLVVCVVTGVIVAACMLPFKVTEDWPTPEMYNRGSPTSFWVGFPVAFFSGLGVAVSLLDDQTNSLVGVAISASLLPPAVNAGMLWVSYWAYDPTRHIYEQGWDRHDFQVMGLYSLGITLVNVALIIVSSMLMFRLKERLPIQKSVFWTDLGVARKIYRNLAIIPKVQEGPSPTELQKRATMLTGRASQINFGGHGSDSYYKSSRKGRLQVPVGSDETKSKSNNTAANSKTVMPIITEEA